VTIRLLQVLMFLLALCAGTAAARPAILLGAEHEGPLGHYADYLQETGGALTVEGAIAAYNSGRFTAGGSPILTFGIGSAPVWIRLVVDNPNAFAETQRLSIETAWLDQVDVYFHHDGQIAAAHHVGDRSHFGLRPIASRYFLFDHAFAPGTSEVFVRVQTPDPMVVPIYLTSPERTRALQQKEDYSYGFLYGFIFALLAYNLMLFAGLRAKRYLLYSLYLSAFLLMNISYTGHGSAWLWPNHTTWAQWSNPILMLLYGTLGLLFALRFLDTRRHFPRLHRAVLIYAGAGATLLLLAVLLGNQRIALLIAFTFVFLFAGIMLALGIVSARAKVQASGYFLLAAMAAMVGAALTALSVWGFIPFSPWTFRAVDIGMLLDATLLALALTYQFRLGQSERQRAELLARLDPLTGLNNRRAFYDITAPLWNVALRHNQKLSVILLDIDHFKHLNDTHGHAFGDVVLNAVARILEKSIRSQDVAARWGGEEFILLLPQTDVDEATLIADRLRNTIAGTTLRIDDAEIAITVSLGVAQLDTQHHSLDDLISSADHYLYESKDKGRNRVSRAPVEVEQGRDIG